MKISAIVASLVLGISSVAAAAPHAPAVHRNPVAAARFAPSMVRPLPSPTRWTLLDTSKPSRFGRMVIDVNSRARFSKLKLEATRGVASIDKVMLTYANGRTQTVEVDKRIGGYGAQSFSIIELDGRNARQISKIVILSKSGTRASYSISAA
jgi:hypothetical protein